jgi:class 3 adenylate cyclase
MTPGAEATVSAPRRSLFRKYFLALFAAVVVPLLANGAGEAWFGYRDQRDLLDRLLRAEADHAAATIEGFLVGIRDQLGWAVQQAWSEESQNQHRLTALGLLRQVPAIVNLTLVDGENRERIYVSRLGLNRVDAGADMSGDPAVAGARASRQWSGPVFFHLNSEPFMTMSLAGNRRSSGIALAEVNLKLIWDVVAVIKVGDTGDAFVVDQPGRLIAHPDIDLVLRGTDDRRAAALSALRDTIAAAGGAPMAVLLPDGVRVVATTATVPSTGWTVFVEQPMTEAFAPIYAALWRTAGLLWAGAVLAAGLAFWLARRMSDPIRRLQVGTQRIGAGQFDHRIDIATGDELESLAQSFNRMSGELAASQEKSERINRLRGFLAPQVAELVESSGSETLLAGQLRDVVVVFGDLRGFTAFSGAATPDEIIAVLGEYYQAMGEAINAASATLVSIAGDGMMVLVNAPLPCDEPARRAIDLAKDMQARVQALAQQWADRGHSIGFGVGLAKGTATVGTIGYEGRTEYTAIGPVTNLAARLCGVAANRQILVNDAAAAAAVGVALRPAPARSLKGFGNDLALFEVDQGGGPQSCEAEQLPG